MTNNPLGQNISFDPDSYLEALGALEDGDIDLGAAALATGHYVQRIETGGRAELHAGVDAQKDQSYFLFGVPDRVLRKMIFPLGGMRKPEARAHGRRLGVPNADKPDSVELCFVPDGDVGKFVQSQGRERRPGKLVDGAGAVLGTHSGVEAFTLGQRRGLGIGGGGSAKFVLKIVPDSAEVVLGDEADLFRENLEARDAQWVHAAPKQAFCGKVRIRYRHEPADATIAPTDQGFRVHFSEPQRAGTPGQAAVIYRGDEVLGGGFIA